MVWEHSQGAKRKSYSQIAEIAPGMRGMRDVARKRMSCSRIRLFTAACGCFLLEIITSAPFAPAADKLRVSYASVTGNTAVITYIAQRAGLFEKQGLDVELILITGGPASISALLNADVDLDLRAPIAAMQAM